MKIEIRKCWQNSVLEEKKDQIVGAELSYYRVKEKVTLTCTMDLCSNS